MTAEISVGIACGCQCVSNWMAAAEAGHSHRCQVLVVVAHDRPPTRHWRKGTGVNKYWKSLVKKDNRENAYENVSLVVSCWIEHWNVKQRRRAISFFKELTDFRVYLNLTPVITWPANLWRFSHFSSLSTWCFFARRNSIVIIFLVMFEFSNS